MKNLGLKWSSITYEFPTTAEPLWKNHVQRWYQLDAYSYGLCEGAKIWQDSFLSPSLLILASPTASNETDRRFIEKGAISPAHFAHTLPNIRSSPFCQVLNWSGPVLCIQRDPGSIIQGLKEGFELAGLDYPVIWILGVFKRAGAYQAHCFQVSNSAEKYHLQKTKVVQGIKRINDKDVLNWLGSRQYGAADLGGYELVLKE